LVATPSGGAGAYSWDWQFDFDNDGRSPRTSSRNVQSNTFQGGNNNRLSAYRLRLTRGTETVLSNWIGLRWSPSALTRGPALSQGFVNRRAPINSGATGTLANPNSIFAIANINATEDNYWGVIFRYPGWFSSDDSVDGRANSNQVAYWGVSPSGAAAPERIADGALVQARTYSNRVSYANASARWNSPTAGPILTITAIYGTRRT